MPKTLYYSHDPMCSWCWAFRPAFNILIEKLPKEINVIRLLGGLASDSDIAMPNNIREYVLQNWRAIEEKVPGTKFNYDFWEQCKPRRSTYPACRAVIAARKQKNKFDTTMTLAIQEAYYLQARNPSNYDDNARGAIEKEVPETKFIPKIIIKFCFRNFLFNSSPIL